MFYKIVLLETQKLLEKLLSVSPKTATRKKEKKKVGNDLSVCALNLLP